MMTEFQKEVALVGMLLAFLFAFSFSAGIALTEEGRGLGNAKNPKTISQAHESGDGFSSPIRVGR